MSIRHFLVRALALACALSYAPRLRAEGVGQVLTSKSIPAATVALIDPESGTSSGGSKTDVNVAAGDVILFQFNFAAVPDLRSSGIQGYLTEFIPDNTQVVGVRLIDKNGLTVVPHLPGVAPDACATNCNAASFDNLPCAAGAGCVSSQVDLANGSIAQVYADTGIFYAADSRLVRTPVDQFITLQNGVDMTQLGKEPSSASAIAPLIGLGNTDHIYGHTLWDFTQMLAYGWKNNAVSGNNGKNNTPFLYGSPVAGPQTYYQLEATNTTTVASTTSARFDGVVGPWQRVRYPGSKIGTGSAVTSSTGPLSRMGVDTTAANWGLDLRPNQAVTDTATALRYALGEVRVGEIRAAEVALRVLDTPLDTAFGATGGDVDCAEVLGSDVSAESSGARADDNPWAVYLPSPNCVYLNLLFDLQVNKPVADGNDVLVYTLRVKNLSTLPQSSVQIVARYAGNLFGFASASHGGALLPSCPVGIGGAGNTCIGWTTPDLQPSDEYTYTFNLSVGGQGSGANVVFASYSSTNLPAPGFTTQALTIVKPVAVLEGRMWPATPTVTAGAPAKAFTAVLGNRGNNDAVMKTMTLKLPSGFTVSGTPALSGGGGGSPSVSCSAGCGTSAPTYTFSGTTVRPAPQCSDGVDNADAEDALADSLDPGCASPLDDDETSGTSLYPRPAEVTIDFNVNVPDGTIPDVYAIELQTFHTQTGIGGDTETYFDSTALALPACSDGVDNDGDTFFDYPSDPQCASALDDSETAAQGYVPDFGVVAVGMPRSARPTLTCPIGDNATIITGLLDPSTPTSATVKLYFGGIERASGVTATQAYSVSGFATLPACMDGANNDGDANTDYPSDPGCATPWDDDEGAATTVNAAFGELYGGLEIRATATGNGELESPLSEPCFVSVVPNCQDGKDNDNDGLIDFPADPGCSSANDGSEDDPQCSDGLDNDGDGDIDFPDDYECATPDDTTEDGVPACSDGLDNDGDGDTDAGDPDCVDSLDRSEATLDLCNDGVDNDGDGDVDFPADPGCHSQNDDDETDLSLGDIRTRLLLLFDTSGSMNWHTCADSFTGGDGSLDCGGADVACATCASTNCGNGLPDDSRLFKAKDGVSDVVAGFGEVEYALMRFHQRATTFACPTQNASASSGGWQGAGAAPCGGGFAGGDLLVGFGAENQYDLLEYLDGQSNYAGNTPAGLDIELRGSGTTPLAGALGSAQAELSAIRTLDPAGGCRPYQVILLTDGAETCGGDPVAAASGLAAAGYEVHVIGFATTSPQVIQNLNDIAVGGGTSAAIFVDDSATLAAAMSKIVADSILTEVCDGIDNDCDLLIDEGFTLYCDMVGAHPAQDLCSDPGETVCDLIDDNCDGIVDEGVQNACGSCGPVPAEICNKQDDDCDGVIDEGGVCGTCVIEPEICDNKDNDCDGLTDESLTRACGKTLGRCVAGTETCSAGAWIGCDAIGPIAETCNNQDDDCDGQIDGISRPCGTSTGACQPGTQQCVAGAFGACVGGIGPTAELCNGVDDDCDGTVDDGNPGAGGVCGSAIGECSTGTLQCQGGALTCVGAAGPTPELCDGDDDDCDGAVDDGVPTNGPCGVSQGDCKPGVLTCQNGGYVCVGQTSGGPESCDNRDNDCDGVVDEGLTRSCGISTGECATGVETCSAGAWINCTAQGPVAESCDGDDDNCNGVADDGVPTAGACGPAAVGVCSPGVLTCKNGGFTCIGAKTGGPESCDNLDNDCDGQTDEGLTQACGTSVGECTVGLATCSAGAWINCTGQGPVPEVCDGLDNDCNGLVDDGAPNGGPCGGGLGACEPGVNVCISGGYVCLGAIQPGPESCDNVDNDCDGQTDEGLSRVCGTDVGECIVGQETCSAGSWVGCTAVQPAPEACDGLDNDCNGLIDDGAPNGGPCGGSVGDCEPGVLVCISGGYVCLGAQLGGPESCDNADNDCDGTIDEGLSRACGTDVGECSLGQETCDAGNWIDCDAVQPSPEVCDGLDNDCNNLIDDGVPTAGPCGGSVGDCSPGVLTCVSGSLVCLGAQIGGPEACDNADNDCDGATDEGLNQPCGTDIGECVAGTETCAAGSWIGCDAVGALPEVCDGLDNDCNGLVDEGNPGGGGACGNPTVGACQSGVEKCEGGTLVCVGDKGGSPELCDNLDNDCDGVIDNGDPEGGKPCGSDTGECQSGVTQCLGGVLICNGAIGPVMPELCNGKDDDCDGVIDDGLPVGAPCGTSVGACEPGVYQCVSDMLSCEGEVGPTPELCNGKDDDCDGTVDNGDPESGAVCGSEEGLCEPGVQRCINGQKVCVGDVEPVREACDCADNDCDGDVDEAPDTGTLCPQGASCVDCQCALPCLVSEFDRCPTGRFPLQIASDCFCVASKCDPDSCARNAEISDDTGKTRCSPDDPSLPACVCKHNACTYPCDAMTCEQGSVCVEADGSCVEDNCRGLGCPQGELCDVETLACETDKCASVDCGKDTCRDGACEKSCATVLCPEGERCAAGACTEDKCAAALCKTGEVCDQTTGECTTDLCLNTACAAGLLCDGTIGQCVVDRCTTVHCPGEQRCVAGECALPAGTRTDAGVVSDDGRLEPTPPPPDPDEDPEKRIAVTGGGGCACTVATSDDTRRSPALALGLLLLLAFGARTRRRS